MNPTIKNIVLAEDDSDDVFFFKDAVAEACPDIKLTVANDGVELIELLDNIPTPDAIVIDLNMPRMNGKECLEEIRNKEEFNEVPVIILSTSNQQEDIDHCIANGANHYYIKSHYEDLKILVKDLCFGNLS